MIKPDLANATWRWGWGVDKGSVMVSLEICHALMFCSYLFLRKRDGRRGKKRVESNFCISVCHFRIREERRGGKQRGKVASPCEWFVGVEVGSARSFS